jgi:glyoxylate reductase
MKGRSVLLSAELKTLLSPSDLRGLDATWIEPTEAVPAGAFEAFVPLLVRKVTETDLSRLPNVRIIANCAVGYENIDLAAAARRGIPVTNTPGVLTEATADLTMGLIISVARGMFASESFLRQGTWKGWHPAEFLGLELSGATLGIVGAGRIGQAVARRAVAFGMRIVYHARNPVSAFEAATGATRVSLDELLATSDIVSVHIPSTDTTRGLFDADRFARMKRGSYFVNTSRGDIVDDAALAQALESGHLAGAGLDVFKGEPRVNPILFRAPRLTMLPHIASATTKTRRAMASLALQNVQAVLAGGAPLTPVPMPGRAPTAQR